MEPGLKTAWQAELNGYASNDLPKREADFIVPMECALVSKLPEGPDWTYEVKFDGYRAIGVKSSRDTVL